MQFTVSFWLFYLFDWKFADHIFCFCFKGKICAPGKLSQWVCSPKRAQLASSAEFAQACSLPELSYNIVGLKKFAKSTEKHLCRSLLMKKGLPQKCYSVNLVKFCGIFVIGCFWIFKHPSRNNLYPLLAWF